MKYDLSDPPKYDLPPAFVAILSKVLLVAAIASLALGWTQPWEGAGTVFALVGTVLGGLAAYVWEHQDRGVVVNWWALLIIPTAVLGMFPPPSVQIASTLAVLLAIGWSLSLRPLGRPLGRSLVGQGTNASPPATTPDGTPHVPDVSSGDRLDAPS